MASTQFKQIAKPRELILSTVVFLVLIFGFYNMIYVPKSQKLKDAKGKIQELNNERKSLESQNQALKALREKKQNVPEETSGVKAQILEGNLKPEFKTLDALMSHILSHKNLDGVIIDTLSVKEVSSSSGIKRSPLNIRAHGPFKSLIAFLSLFDDVKALVSVDALKLSSDTAVGGEMNMELDITLYQVEGTHDFSEIH